MDDSAESSWRYEPITLPTEWVELYRPGGLHPVSLGDKLKKGRYEIVRKLGHGSFSTVWLAQDTRCSLFVAIKISRADARKATKKGLRILRMLEQADGSSGDCSAKNYVVTLLDSFKHTGPNGIHRCLVFEPLGPNVKEVLESMPASPSWYEMVKSVLKQMLLGLHFLHSNKTTHGDGNPGNILFTLRPFTEKYIKELTRPPSEDKVSPLVKRKDGEDDESAPKLLYLA
ncbi:kinase-like protein [Cadophora sp. DSE1049]|nr:kinase-like protein [Cadophora sp. DSE1049]